LNLIKQGGVALIIMGPQRFGINGNNLHHGKGVVVLKGGKVAEIAKTKESFWLSRYSLFWCFNEALSDQVA